MRKNTASQVVAFQMNSTTDGSAVTSGTPTVYYTVDGGTQGTGTGTATHEGNGQWSYVPAQAETNGDHVAFTMALSGAISQTVNLYPVSYDPTDAVRLGLTALPNAAADAAGGLPISDAGGLDIDTMNSNISAILVDTGTTIPAQITALNNLSAADVWTYDISAIVTTGQAGSELNDASSGAGGDATAANQTTIITHLTDIKGATWASSTDTLEAIRDRGDAAWTTGAGGSPPQLLQSTTIATLASQTSFTLTAGSSDDNAYNGATVVITDSATSTQKAVGVIADYTGSTKTVTLMADPGIFTMAAGDTVEVIAGAFVASSSSSVGWLG